MKGPIFWLKTGFLFSWILVGGVSCAPKAAVSVEKGPTAGEIQSIRVEKGSSKTEVFVVGEKPMTYTTFHLIEPERLVVDLLEVGLGSFTEAISVSSDGPVRRILPKVTEEGRVARLEMELGGEVETHVRQEGATLVIDVLSPSNVAMEPEKEKAPLSEAAVAPVVAAPKDSVVAKRATMISEIRFDKTDGLQLVVVADGQLESNPFYLDAQRLVIDFPSVLLATKVEAIPANHPAVKQVRIGGHSDKVRMVLDILSPIEYTIKQSGNELRVGLLDVSREEGKSTIKNIVDSKQSTQGPPPPIPAPAATVVSPASVAPPVSPIVSPPPPKAVVEKKRTPEPVATALSPPAIPEEAEAPSSVQPLQRYMGKKISLDFQDAEIADIIRLIAEVSQLNIVLSDDVKGKMTLKLVSVPWDQALDVILKMNILGQFRDGNIIVISTLSSISQRQDEEARAKESGIKAEDRVTKVISLNYSTADTLIEPLRKLLSPRGDITVDKRTNTVIIKDIVGNMEDVIRMARVLDTRTPQVSIEARIVQVSPKFNRSLGVQWGGSYKDVSDNNLIQVSNPLPGTLFGVPQPSFAVNLPASSSLGGLGFTFGRFTDNPLALDLRLSAGESQGMTKVVSTPKVTVLDNQEAKIQQGESIPFSTLSNAGTQTIFVDASITLSVTPHISADGGIVMKINVTKNAPGELRAGAAGPSIFKKEATTNVLVLDRETIVIGGIQETTEVESISGIPFLSKIPILGWLFKNKESRKEDSELLVFLTPRLVKYSR